MHQQTEAQIENAKLATALGNFTAADRKAGEAANELRSVVAKLSGSKNLPGAALAAREAQRALEAAIAPFGGATGVDHILSSLRDAIQRSGSFDPRREAYPADLASTAG